MKLIKPLFILLILASISHNTKASWTTEGLNDAETQTIDDASSSELKELSDCMYGSNETDISKTACINDVFGDVHN